MSPEAALPLYLLTIRGQLKPATLEAARAVHNATAGAPANVAAARALGDLSHMVYVPANQTGPEAGEFLILDVWNSLEGLNQFFANKQVQEQAGEIFAQRDPVVWQPAPGFFNYYLPAPHGRDDRTVAFVRGRLPSLEQGQAVHNQIVTNTVQAARMAGDLSHAAYLRLAAPGTPEALEFCALDVWMDPVGMSRLYSDPAFPAALAQLFAGAPTQSAWRHPAGEWVEW